MSSEGIAMSDTFEIKYKSLVPIPVPGIKLDVKMSKNEDGVDVTVKVRCLRCDQALSEDGYFIANNDKLVWPDAVETETHICE